LRAGRGPGPPGFPRRSLLLLTAGAFPPPPGPPPPHGTFRINDLPRATGSTTYEVGYAGDALHSPSTASATVRVRRAG
ncbi:hypothetical protein JS521_29825, partial [Streptomyces sp. RHZ10]